MKKLLIGLVALTFSLTVFSSDFNTDGTWVCSVQTSNGEYSGQSASRAKARRIAKSRCRANESRTKCNFLNNNGSSCENKVQGIYWAR